MKNHFYASLKIVRFTIKRERINILIWLSVLISVILATAFSYSKMYSNQDELLAMSEFFNNPAMVAMMGRHFADEISIYSLFSASMLTYLCITSAIMNIFFVIRTSRGDEECGRVEIIRSLPVGRLSGLSATMIISLIFNLILSLFTFISLLIVNLNGSTAYYSLLFSLSLGVIGFFFASLSAIFCQLFSNSKSALGASLAFLGVMFILRAMGDVEYEPLALISPLGLILRTQSGSFLPILIVFFLSLLSTLLTFYLNSIRDLEQGLIPQKNGRTSASNLLKLPEGLAIRLTKNSIIAWIVGIFLVAISYGAILGDIEAFISGSGFLADMLVAPEGHTKSEVFLTMIISMLSIASAVVPASVILRLAAEEKNRRYENVFSRAVSRSRLLTGYLIISLLTSFFMLFCAMFGIYLAAIFVMEEAITFTAIFKSFMIYLPAIWAIIALSVVLISIIPSRSATIINGYLGYSFAIIYLGEIIDFADWIAYTTPYGFIPKLPFDSVNFLTLGLLLLASSAFILAGYYLYNRRDLL